MKPSLETERFNSGVCRIMNEDGNLLFEGLRFQNRVLGIKRFYTAAMAQFEIDRVIRVPQQRAITPHCITWIKDICYRIELAQHYDDTNPAVTDLTLRQLEMRLSYGG